MYQGKFTSNNANQGELNEELLASRMSQPGKPRMEPDLIRPRKPAREEPVRQEAPKAPKAAAQNAAKAAKAAAPRKAPRVSPAPAAEDYEDLTAVEEAPARRRGPSLGTVIFYTLYFLFIGLFVGATFLGLNWLNGWLVNYEAAQPTVKCQQVFDTLFKNPDWGQIYDLSGMEGTQYESKDAFVTYMENKVTDPKELNFVETSAGISNDGLEHKKYFVRLGEEKIGYFTLKSEKAEKTDIPDWKMGEVEMIVSRNESYRINKVDGHTVYINGVALTDEHTIQIASTKADSFLPVGVTSARTCVQEIGGLLVEPQVVIKNASGVEMPVIYDAEKKMFVEQTETNTITPDLESIAINTAETYGKYMIAAASRAALGKVIATDSETYKTITSIDLWMKTKKGYEIKNQEVSEYCRYSENVFSARVKLNLIVTGTNGYTKDYEVNSTFFFNKRDSGWICYSMTNEDVQAPVGQVRLTFMNGTEKLDSRFVRTDAKELQLPVVSAPAGKTFTGWVQETITESGTKELTVIFTPDEDGKVSLQNGVNLLPMTLYTYFE